jgi:hypothetical protein
MWEGPDVVICMLVETRIRCYVHLILYRSIVEVVGKRLHDRPHFVFSQAWYGHLGQYKDGSEDSALYMCARVDDTHQRVAIEIGDGVP